MKRKPKTYDYSRLGAYSKHDLKINLIYEKGFKLSATGRADGIQAGDFLVFDVVETGGQATYKFQQITYFNSPSDMWRAILISAPRQLHELPQSL